MTNPSERKLRDLEILENIISTFNGIKIYEKEMKETIFEYLNGNLSADNFYKSYLNNRNDFLDRMIHSQEIFLFIEDELIKDKEKLRTVINLKTFENFVSHSDVASGIGDCSSEGDSWDFTDEYKEEAVNNRGCITCPFCNEEIYIFDLYNSFYEDNISLYLTDLYKKKFSIWIDLVEAASINKSQNQLELFPIDERQKRDLLIISTDKKYKLRAKKAEKKAEEAGLIQEEKKLSKIKNEEKYKNEFPAMMQEIATYLSWGRRNDYIGDWEEESDGLQLAIYWNLDWDFDKRYKATHKTKTFKEIAFRFWLYEEVFGRLTDTDFIYPGNKDNPYDIFLEGYKKLIKVTHKFLSKFGDVKQEKNYFSLKSMDLDFIKGHRDYMHELKQALYDEFESI